MSSVGAIGAIRLTQRISSASSGERHADGRTPKPGDGDGSAPEKLRPDALTPSDRRRVDELVQTDRRVRAHEAAHQAAAGSMGGAATFTYETGPDGKSYAVGGEVPVDLSSGQTPEETIARAQQVRAAALAPADPSPQDRAVAAQASQMEAVARTQLAQEQLAALATRGADSAGSPSSGPHGSDVGLRALAVMATVQSERSGHEGEAHTQHMARLATAAYRR